MRTYPIVKLTLGNQTVEFRDTDVIEAEVVQEISPLSIELPISEATIRIHTLDPRYSPFSDGEFYRELVNNTIVDVYEYYDDGVSVPTEQFMGRFYLKEWRNPAEGEFEFVCQDAIGVLDTIPFDGMFWAADVMLGHAVETVLDPAGIPFRWGDKEAGERLVKGYLPAGTVREALQQVLFAGRCRALTANSRYIVLWDAILPAGAINDPPLEYGDPYYGAAYFGGGEYDGVIAAVDKTDKQSLKLTPLVTGVQLISHDFTQGTIQEEIYSAYLEPGDYKIVYSKPYYGVTAEGVGATPAYLMTEDLAYALTTEDGKILSFAGAFEFGVNHVYLHVITAGNVVVRGYPYIDSTRVFSYDEAEATKAYSSGKFYGDATYGTDYYAKYWTVSAAPNIWKVDKAMLVTASMAQDVLDSLVEFAKLRYQQSLTLFPNTSVLPGQIELVDSLYGKDINAVVTRTVSKLSGGYLIDAELVGLEKMN